MADGADQGEIALIGAGEDQPAVAVLEYIDIVAVEQAADDDLADLDRGKLGAGWRSTVSATVAVQAPVALTSARAVTT